MDATSSALLIGSLRDVAGKLRLCSLSVGRCWKSYNLLCGSFLMEDVAGNEEKKVNLFLFIASPLCSLLIDVVTNFIAYSGFVA